jgi:hypothetical protein
MRTERLTLYHSCFLSVAPAQRQVVTRAPAELPLPSCFMTLCTRHRTPPAPARIRALVAVIYCHLAVRKSPINDGLPDRLPWPGDVTHIPTMREVSGVPD